MSTGPCARLGPWFTLAEGVTDPVRQAARKRWSVQPRRARRIRRKRVGRVLAVVAFVGGVGATVGFAVPASASPACGPSDCVVGSVTSPAEYGTATLVGEAFSQPDGSNPFGSGSVVARSAAGSVVGFASGGVSCLRVSGNQATVGLVLDRATGVFSGTPAGTAVVAFVQDNGVPVNGHAVDRTELGPNPDPTGSTCPAPKYPSQLALSGNLTVHDA